MSNTNRTTSMYTFSPINPEKTGKHIYRLLANEGYTVQDVSDLLGFASVQAVYKWRSGKGMPSTDALDMISQILHVTINDLLVHDSDAEVSLILRATIDLSTTMPFVGFHHRLAACPSYKNKAAA